MFDSVPQTIIFLFLVASRSIDLFLNPLVIINFNLVKFSIIFFTLLFFYSFYAVKDAESEFKNKDPRQIVIDEVLGQAMPLILLLYLNQTK